MATIQPFKALRPKSQYVHKVASLPYDVMSTEEAKTMVQGNSYSFLHIDLPEILLKEGEAEGSEIKYTYAKEYLNKLIKENIIEEDEQKSYYIYQLENGLVTQRGIVGCASVEDYNNGVIKKHENTRADKAYDRIRHVDVCNAHTGPIFLAYRKNDTLKSIIRKFIDENEPIYDFIADDEVTHTVWKIDSSIGEIITQEFEKIDTLYIADGHHRAAAAVEVANIRQKHQNSPTTKEEYNYFLSVAFDEEELCIMDYNRVVKDCNGLNAHELLEAVSKNFVVEAVEDIYKPQSKHSFGMYCNKKWYSIIPKENIISQDPVESLDVSILQDYILDPILGIKEPRTDNRIEFIGGIRGVSYLQDRADEYQGIAFSMFPTSIEELMEVADLNQLMPPKSTWFEPKLRSGIFIHSL